MCTRGASYRLVHLRRHLNGGEAHPRHAPIAMMVVAVTAPPSEFPGGDPAPGPSPHGKVVIYGQPTSRVCKVMWVCAELGVEFEQHNGFAFRNDPWALELNPKGTVPFIKDGDLVLNESNTITAYIAQKYGAGTSLYPETPEKLAQAWQWLEFGEQYLVPRMNPVFFGVVRGSYAPSLNKPGTPPAEEIEIAVPKCVEAFTVLEQHLQDKDYMLGDNFTIADITVAIQANRLICNDGFGFDALAPSNFPSILAWHGRLSARPAFVQHVLPRYK